MTEDDRLRQMLQDALPGTRTDSVRPARDLWPSIEHRIDERQPWSRLDLALLVVVVLLLLVVPDWLFLLAFHL